MALRKKLCLRLLLAALFSSCGKEAGLPVNEGEALHVAVMQEAPSLDLHKTSTLIARQIGSGQIWEKLLTLNSRSEAEPELAEAWEVSEGGRVFSFRLRRGVKFHDGSLMDAADVTASMNRWIDSYAAAREIAGASRFTPAGDYEVEIRFENPAVTFPEVMAGAPQPAVIVPAEICAEEDSRGFMKRYIGTGPFRFSRWEPGEYILLEKFDAYTPYGDPARGVDGWAGHKAPGVEQVYYHTVPHAAARMAGLETGRFQVDYHVDNDDLPRLARLENTRSLTYEAGSLTFIFNKKRGPGADLYFRRAVNAACGAEDILGAVFGDQWAVNSSYMEDTQPYWRSPAGQEYYNLKDPELAAELLRLSAYRGETLRILTSTPGTTDRGVLVFMQQLEAAGIKAEMTVVDWATLLQYRTDPDRYDIYTSSFYSVPLPSLKLFFSPSFPGWTEDEKLAALLEEFNTAESREEARRAWEKLQGYSWECLPVINVGHFSQTHAWDERVENLSAWNGLYFWNAVLKKQEN
ncbi:MAG: ABC transporter substrate-binding protein [Treponema sp.]|nr:ABC transporter substrate-binding protein [Treponema sp.]